MKLLITSMLLCTSIAYGMQQIETSIIDTSIVDKIGQAIQAAPAPYRSTNDDEVRQKRKAELESLVLSIQPLTSQLTTQEEKQEVRRLIEEKYPTGYLDDACAAQLEYRFNGEDPFCSRLQYFLAAGANVNSTHGCFRETMLHMAAAKHIHDLIRFLLEHGAAPNELDERCRTPLDYTIGANDNSMKLLLDYGAEPNRNSVILAAFHTARGHLESADIERLVKPDWKAFFETELIKVQNLDYSSYPLLD